MLPPSPTPYYTEPKSGTPPPENINHWSNLTTSGVRYEGPIVTTVIQDSQNFLSIHPTSSNSLAAVPPQLILTTIASGVGPTEC